MSDIRFDRILQDKLKGHQISFDESRWADMEKVLDDAEHAQLIDQEVRARIIDHTYPYKESHWEILKRKLEFEKELKEKIYISKIAEVAILFLLLLSFINVKENLINKSSHHTGQLFAASLDINKSTNEQNVLPTELIPGKQHLEKIESNTPEHQHGVNQKKIIQEDIQSVVQAPRPRLIEKPANSSVFLQTPSSTTKNPTISRVDIKHSQVPTHNTFGIISYESEDIQNLDDVSPQTQPGLPEYDKEPIHDENVLRIQTVTESQKPVAVTTETTDKEVSRSLLTISALLASIQTSILDQYISPKIALASHMRSDLVNKKIDIASITIDHPVLVANMKLAKPLVKKERWIGAMTGVDMNYVRSIIIKNNVSGPRNFLVLSLTTGANYSVKKGKNEFFTGLGYSEKFYDPNISETVKLTSNSNSIESSSYYSRNYTLEKYDIVHLPAQYKRHFGDSHKLHAYAFAGASINFVIYTDYEQHDNLNRGQPRPKRLVDQIAAYKSTDFSNGLLEGGFYKDNIYFTADIGAGLEKQIRRTKFFVESQYKKNLFASQLGPQKVKLNSLSFNIGTKYKI